MPIIEFSMPLKLVSPNTHEHYIVNSKRKKKQREMVSLAMGNELLIRGNPFIVDFKMSITFIRLGKKRMNDHDNLRRAFKHVCDQVCSMLGTKDENPCLQFKYYQRISKYYLVTVKIEQKG